MVHIILELSYYLYYIPLLLEIENISEKNKKIQQNNQYKALLDQIDLQAISSSTVTELESYDELQSELGSVKAVYQSKLFNPSFLKSKGLPVPKWLLDNPVSMPSVFEE